MSFTGKYLSSLQGLSIVFLGSFVVSTAHADPTITGLNGTLAHSNSVTISGAGFGIKSQPSPLAFGDMENNSLAARIGIWSGSMPTGYPSGFMTVSTLHQRNSHSRYNATCNFGTGTTGAEYCSFGQGTSSASWYMQYWYYVDSSTVWGQGNIKMIRLWNNSTNQNMYVVGPYNRGMVTVEGADEGHGSYFSGSCPPSAGTGWYPATSSSICGDAAFGHTCNCADWLPTSFEWRRFHTDMPSGSWHLFQFEYKEGSANGHNGTLRWWADGRLVYDHSNINTNTNGASKFLFHLGWYSSHGTTDISGPVYFDDVYADTTWQRVEIGNSATYNNCTLKEIQIPTSWSDGSIAFTVNQGAFADGATGYIFVTDANGTRNTGYTVTFGSSGTTDKTAPTVSLTAPLSGATVSSNATVTASASDNVGISKVDFYVDSASSTPIATIATVPYTFTWNTTTATNGTHTLYAKASDAAGNSTTSTGVAVTVSNAVVDSTAPTVSISSPASNATLTGSTTVTATASDNVGVTKVDFFVDSTSSTAVYTATSSPYSFTWDPSTVANGSHTIYARASDSAGNTGISNVAVTVSVATSSGTIKRNECASPPTGTLFCEDFEGSNPKDDFDDYDGNPDTENLIVSDSGPAADSSNKAIRLRVPSGVSGLSDLLKVLPSTYDKLYARWYIKYESGFNFSAPAHGGGLTAGDRSYIGLSGNRPAGNDYASFLIQPSTDSIVPYSYSYYRGMYQQCTDPNGSCWGDSLPCIYDSGSTFCTKSQDRPTVTMPKLVAGQWYCYEQMIDMGTASTTGTGATGRITQWLDGNQFGDNTNLWLRTTANLKLQNLWLALFHHDGTHSDVGELIDNVVVSTQRIGCGGSSGTVTPVSNLKTIKVTP